ncbi:DUF1684 domain-containing protein [Polaribacter tangerinus]|uniref:DUF1684 domain-containing protein n=1 Tax=Polaribacter tangerinus TaxID=1920034 RepID=UPI000B4B8FE8|nr:DUF1684 domain-containing protein [Polaribacter tangerinus]
MKKIVFVFLILISISCNSNKKRALVGKTTYQQELNAQFKDASVSPLKKKDLKNFKGLDFFPVDSSFITIAKFSKIENAPTFLLPTSTDIKKPYKEFGKLTFTLQGKQFQLTVYQGLETIKIEKYKNELYLPFTDLTTGNESYVAGRYMDLQTTDIRENNTVELNFNNTYNPYCAYNDNFSCPITPRNNHLDIAVTAGIKTFKK